MGLPAVTPATVAEYSRIVVTLMSGIEDVTVGNEHIHPLPSLVLFD